MALAVAALGTFASTSNFNPTVITLTDGAAVGEAVVVFGRKGTTITSVVDSKGNTYTQKFDVPTDANSGTGGGVFACDSLTTALVAGDTISITTSSTGHEALACAFKITGKAVTYDANVVHTDETGVSPWGPLGPFTPAKAETVLLAVSIGSNISSPTITSTNLDGVGWTKFIDFRASSNDARMAASYSLRATNSGAESVSGTITSPSFNKHHVMLFSYSPSAAAGGGGTTGQTYPHGKKGTSPTTGQLFPRRT